MPKYCCDWYYRERWMCMEREEKSRYINRYTDYFANWLYLNVNHHIYALAIFLCKHADKHRWAIRLSAQTGGFWTDQGCYLPPSTFPKIEWKLIYTRIEDGDWQWKISLHPFFLLSPLALREVRSGWVIIDCQDYSGWRANTPGDSFSFNTPWN